MYNKIKNEALKRKRSNDKKVNIDKLELYKEMYYNELERRELINSRITLPLGIIVVVFGTIPTYFLPIIINNIYSPKNIILIILLLLMTFTLILSTVFVTKTYIWKSIFSLKKYEYAFIPLPEDIEIYLKTEDGKNDCIEDLLLEAYADTIKVNYKENNNKESFLHEGLKWLICSVSIGAVMIFANYINMFANILKGRFLG